MRPPTLVTLPKKPGAQKPAKKIGQGRLAQQLSLGIPSNGLLSGRRRRPLKGSPPSAAQTERAVFPHSAFMNGFA
jgi:hypothetical protein